jgi:hypothetical protein
MLRITDTFTIHEEVYALPTGREIIQTKTVDKIETHLMFSNPFPENRSVYEVMWKSTVRPDGPHMIIQGVPLATELGISLIILTQIKILQRNLNRSTFVV